MSQCPSITCLIISLSLYAPSPVQAMCAPACSPFRTATQFLELFSVLQLAHYFMSEPTHKGQDCILSMLTGHISGHKIGDSNLGPRVWYLMSGHVHIQTSLRVQVRVGAGLTGYLVSMINWSVPCCAVLCYVVCVNYVLWAPILRCPSLRDQRKPVETGQALVSRIE